MSEVNRPAVRPARPFFSSGPCAKRPGWTPEALNGALVGRSHRSKPGKARLQAAIDRTREVLEVPADYLIGITPGSAFSASFEVDDVAAMREQLKAKGVEVTDVSESPVCFSCFVTDPDGNRFALHQREISVL